MAAPISVAFASLVAPLTGWVVAPSAKGRVVALPLASLPLASVLPVTEFSVPAVASEEGDAWVAGKEEGEEEKFEATPSSPGDAATVEAELGVALTAESSHDAYNAFLWKFYDA